MKIAILNSIEITDLDVSKYIPSNCDAVIMGGIFGYDKRVKDYAFDNDMDLIMKLPFSEIATVEFVIEDADVVVSFVKEHDKVVSEICRRFSKLYTEIIR